MNRFTEENQTEAASLWQRPSKLPKRNFKAVVLHALTLLLSTLSIPLCEMTWASFAVWISLCSLCVLLCKKNLLGSILTVCASVLLLPSSLFASVLILAVSVGIMSGAYLMTAGKSNWTPVAISAVSFGIAYAVTGDWMLSLTAFFLLPAELLLCVATRRGEYRVNAICASSVGLLLSFAVLFAVLLKQNFGGVALSNLKAAILALQEGFETVLNTVREEMIATMNSASESGANTAQMKQLIEQYMSKDRMTDLVLLYSYLLPAMLIILCSVISFLAQKMLNAAYQSSGFACAILPENEFFTVSVPAAVLFTVSFALSCFISPIGSFGAVVINLTLILLPAMCVLGIRKLRTFIHRKNIGIAVAVGLFGLCSGQLLFILGLYGAYGRVEIAVRAKLSENQNKGQGPFDGE